jgi:hypothetical protein
VSVRELWLGASWKSNESADSMIEEFDPYHRQWDGIIPVKDDPLTRMRLLVSRLRNSIEFRNDVNDLETFETS